MGHKGIHYLNNKKVENTNCISILNPSFLYGINCFEGIRAYWFNNKLRVIDLESHIDRLYKSAKKLSLKPPLTKARLLTHVQKILEKEEISFDAYIRVTIFAGNETGSWHERSYFNNLISITEKESFLHNPKSFRLKVSTFKRISINSMPPDVKAGANYLNSRYAHLEALDNGYDGALFLTNKGYVSESTGSCIFFISENSVETPNLDSDILNSITRKRIIKLCRSNNINVIEKQISINLLETYKAAFLVGTMMEVKPVSQIDSLKYDTRDSTFKTILNLFIDSVVND
jgi:branched-chain amino acid aminotransferase